MNDGAWATLFVTTIVALLGIILYRSQRESRIFSEVDTALRQINELTLRILELELERSGYRIWNNGLVIQVLELGGIPVPPPSWLVLSPVPDVMAVSAESKLVKLFHVIDDAFNDNELDDLAFHAGISLNEIAGDTASARARNLIEYAAKRGYLGKLLAEGRRLRPNAPWPKDDNS